VSDDLLAAWCGGPISDRRRLSGSSLRWRSPLLRSSPWPWSASACWPPWWRWPWQRWAGDSTHARCFALVGDPSNLTLLGILTLSLFGFYASRAGQPLFGTLEPRSS